MKNRTATFSMNVLSALLVLMSLLLCVVNPVNSWFKIEHNQGVQISVMVGNLKLKVYQNAVPTDEELEANPTKNEIFTNKINTDEKTSTPQYITLGGEIKPDEPVSLTLILANKDAGSASMYVRFKFEVYVRKINSSNDPEHELLQGVEVSGFDEPEGTTNGFVKNGDYYYYQKSSTGAFNNSNNVKFAKGEDVVMFTHFTVPYSAFVDTSTGELKIKNSESVYIKLIVDGSINTSFN